MDSSDNDFRHHSHRRKRGHDYRAPWKYHVTIIKAAGCPAFGRLTGDLELRTGNPACVGVALSPLGSLIAQEIRAINRNIPQVEVYQYVVMPDHIHILLNVKERMEKPLGYVIGNLTGSVGRKWREIAGDPALKIFEEGYNDRIIYSHRSLDAVFKYIRHNPYRLAVRQARPGFFRKTRSVEIGGRKVTAYGNLFLLRNPFKSQVIVHRADSPETREANREGWIHLAANGGVLVSPFISPAEKAVRAAAEAAGGNIILVVNEVMTDRFKPSGRDFSLCVEGRLLIVAQVQEKPADGNRAKEAKGSNGSRDSLSRRDCLRMNSLAREISLT